MTTIKLSTPIVKRSKSTGEVIDSQTELTMREPTAGDMADTLDVAGGDMSRIGSLSRALACRCTGLSEAEFNALSIKDGMKLIEAAGVFLGAGLETGPTP